MSKTVAILQSNYIPWKGYFDLINLSDEFILYDDMQYTKRDWRNRNIIKTPQGLKWLTIPVEVKGKFFQSIKDVKVSDKNWYKKHWALIKQNYAKAKYFKDYNSIFESLYLETTEEFLSEINYRFIKEINKILGINTKIRWSSEFVLNAGKTEKLLGICKDCNASTYLSGPSAKGYLDEQLAREEGVQLEWMDYSGYPEYAQLNQPFESGVTVLDLIFNEGPESNKYMKSFKDE